MAKNPKILSIVLAGGEGTRLMPLTRDRAKPAVPFGGVFRLIDFPLSNLVNSGICRPWCSPSTSPIRLTVIFPRCGVFRRCSATTSPLFRLSSDLASTGISLCRRHLPDHQHHRGRAAGYCGDRRRDHVYRMDFQQMVQQHIESGAEFTVAGIRQPISQSNQFGVIEVDPEHPNMIKSFQEKPQTTTGLPDDPNSILASMGNYVANTDACSKLWRLTRRPKTPSMIWAAISHRTSRPVTRLACTTSTPTRFRERRDRSCLLARRGTLKQFYDAHMDLISYVPEFNLYNTEWPIYTLSGNLPPAKFVHAGRDVSDTPPTRSSPLASSYRAVKCIIPCFRRTCVSTRGPRSSIRFCSTA